VVVIDGGTKESGQALVDHVRTYYLTDIVDYVFSTHPDGDHASGLTEVLEQLTVRGGLFLHRPWEHSEDICHLFLDGRLTATGLEEKLCRALDEAARELETIALRRRIPIYEPFMGMTVENGTLRVLGPHRDYYRSLIPHFRGTPAPRNPLAQFAVRAGSAVRDAVTWVLERMDVETLTTDPEGTSCENNTSVILLATIDGHRLLFTGDAGVPALTAAADYAAYLGIDLSTLRFLQVPHHGSKRNVDPAILNRIKAQTAFISAAPDGAPKHPAKKVTNALIRRGTAVFATRGNSLRHEEGALPRPGWGAAPCIPFYTQVEE
jgi:beta-lactamase superfamily II metal-dependent hydrolase